MVEGGKDTGGESWELQEFGYRIGLFANTALRVAMKAVQRAMAELRREGTTAGLLEEMASWEDRQQLTGLPEFQRREARYLGLPGGFWQGVRSETANGHRVANTRSGEIRQ